MKCAITVFVLLMLGLTMSNNPVHADATSSKWLVENGQPRAQIVVAADPPRKTRLAAQELQRYIQKISGATLPIVTQPADGVAINLYVGHSPHTQSLGIDTSNLRHGAFHMKSGPNWLALIGEEFNYQPPPQPWGSSNTNAERDRINAEWDQITGDTFGVPVSIYRLHQKGLDLWHLDGAGSLNAVYEFLRGLGCRWYMPGEIGEVVPEASSIALPQVDRLVQADFNLRSLRYFYPLSDEESLWHFRMGVDQGHDDIGVIQPGHGSKFVHMRPEMKVKHPDMFAIWGGKRMIDHARIGAPCLSSPVFFDLHLKFARLALDYYDQPMISLDMCDGYAFLCECDQCKVYNVPGRPWNAFISDYVFTYVDRVARELYRSHPDRKVMASAYSAYQVPPSNIAQMSPNLALVYCQARSTFDAEETRERTRRLRQEWISRLPTKEMYLWEYYLESWPGRRPYEGIPTYYPRLIKEDLASVKGLTRGEVIEVYNHRPGEKFTWSEHTISAINVYVTSRLWWDASLDIDALLEEFYVLFYGPAHAQMKAFIEFSEANWRSMRTNVEAIDKAVDLLAKARAAAGDGIYGKRIDLLVEYTKPLAQLKERLAKGREGNPEMRSLERREEDLVLDGKLDEKFWQGTRDMEMRELTTGRPPEHHTKVNFAWAGDSLVLGIHCQDRDMANLDLSPLGNDDPNIFRRDSVEILLETQVHSYYQIVVSPTGALMDLDRSINRNTEWSSNARVKTYIGDGFWSAEVRIPAAGDLAKDLNPLAGVAGRKPTSTYPWYFNVCRLHVRAGGTEASAVSPTGETKFHNVMKFAKLYVK
jgi:hypothetical protein